MHSTTFGPAQLDALAKTDSNSDAQQSKTSNLVVKDLRNSDISVRFHLNDSKNN